MKINSFEVNYSWWCIFFNYNIYRKRVEIIHINVQMVSEFVWICSRTSSRLNNQSVVISENAYWMFQKQTAFLWICLGRPNYCYPINKKYEAVHRWFLISLWKDECRFCKDSEMFSIFNEMIFFALAPNILFQNFQNLKFPLTADNQCNSFWI